jgi:hypothetical protein
MTESGKILVPPESLCKGKAVINQRKGRTMNRLTQFNWT